MRFLVANGRKQPPVDAGVCACLFEVLPVVAQTAVYVANKGPGADVIEVIGVPVVAVEQLVEDAVTASKAYPTFVGMQVEVGAEGDFSAIGVPHRTKDCIYIKVRR